ncbi:MAG TPA: replication-associated recombination protein A [Candidatus Acidoferrales bacterium]|nr:replication-associated recombination protein A [Candidatus Acidoferrales bacterium]
MDGQFDLFETPADPPADPGRAPDAPLASRIRPTELSQVAGQEAVVAVLGQLAAAGRLPSLVLWGPPGSGKTTLARILARSDGARFVTVSAVSAGVSDLRRLLGEARQARRRGLRTVLFIDELHRFNKSQQDAILPDLEDGTVTMIGATTENPSFEVNAPLLSRSRVFRLEALTEQEMGKVLDAGLAEIEAELDPAARALLIELARGDARSGLNTLEIAAQLAPPGPIQADQVRAAAQRGHLLYDRDGDQHYDIVSALIKSIRGSDADAAVYWLARMLEAGDEVNFVARRLVILASEDVGLADPEALPLAVAAQQAAHLVGMPEAFHPLAQAAIYLALAPKSNSAKSAYQRAAAAVRESGNLAVPLHLRNAASALMREMGYGHGYAYAHDFEGGRVDQEHLPPELRGRRFYEPTPRDRIPPPVSPRPTGAGDG